MRRLIATAAFLVLFLVACSSHSLEGRLAEQDGVRLFLAMAGENVTFSHAEVGGSAFADLARSECPQAGEDDERAVYMTPQATLIAYAPKDAENISCLIFRPAEPRAVSYRTRAEAPEEGLALTVNGAKVPISRVEAELAALPQGTVLNESALALVLTRIINDELLAQQAALVDVSEQDIAQSREALLAQLGVDEAGLDALLGQQNVTRAEFDESVRAQARLRALLAQRLLLDDITVDESLAQEYYLARPDEFLAGERVLVRHLFISAQGRSEDALRARTQQVIDRMNSTDFCALVREYSDDTQRRESCGEYALPRGAIDPQLEAAAFSTPANTTSVVASESGVHFFNVVQVLPAQVLPYAQASQELRAAIANTLFQQRLALYLAMLRSDADIVVYLG